MLQKYNHLFGNCCLDPLLIHKKGIRKSLTEITVEKYNEAKVKNIKIIPGKSLSTNCWTRMSVISRKVEKVSKSLGKKLLTSYDVLYVEEGLFVELDNSETRKNEISYISKGQNQNIKFITFKLESKNNID
ncbi:hypothetical protein PR048_003098 [Dryococelus australis]|uniref:Uncharacterized protein n=1 Tax=Dryococelus australis TaxID=614101 RepID=A0ABQ9IM29_9NEOP|nr:hypothetical protein PR048_003098 [Dryococelus australis]